MPHDTSKRTPIKAPPSKLKTTPIKRQNISNLPLAEEKNLPSSWCDARPGMQVGLAPVGDGVRSACARYNTCGRAVSR